jgi:hypothetical protein
MLYHKLACWLLPFRNTLPISKLTQARIIVKTFVTPLGNVVCGLVSDSTKVNLVGHRAYENGKSELFETKAHQIEIIEFKIRQPLYNGETVTDTFGWVWKIQKRNSENELLEIFCLFENPIHKVEFDTACGESLDAIEVFNETWTLHIGTEDGEVLNSRAENEDEFPARLENKVDFYNSITTMKENGLKTEIPLLNQGEILHLQYLAAYDKRNVEKVNTWLAVDQDKRRLENWIGIGW